MKNVNVEITYFDKHRKKTVLKGTKLELTNERFEELVGDGYVSEIPEEAPKEGPAQKEEKPAAKRKTKEEKSTTSTK